MESFVELLLSLYIGPSAAASRWWSLLRFGIYLVKVWGWKGDREIEKDHRNNNCFVVSLSLCVEVWEGLEISEACKSAA
jgi:hypothetical protein